jgi:hypothetical protein
LLTEVPAKAPVRLPDAFRTAVLEPAKVPVSEPVEDKIAVAEPENE